MDRNDDLIYFKSNKGNKKLLHEGFVYQINRFVGETCYWLCEQRLEKYCGRLIVKNGIITKREDHNHVLDRSNTEVQRSLADMKVSIRDVRQSTSAVINRHMEKMDRQFRPYLPSDGAIRRRLQRSRRKD